MSEDLPIKISLDPTQAVSGAKKVTDEVAKTEAQAARAKAAFEALGKSFDAVGDAMRQQTATALTNTAKGFDSLTEAIRREQAVLERIHGPARQYEQDLKTLDGMLTRNTLTTKQYADEVARLNKQLDASKSGGAAGGNGQLDSIAKNVKSIDFKQAAGAAAQAFGLLNEKLKITDSEFGKVAESAVKFGAMGAQVAGPWGAVAGALLGVALEGEGTFEMLDRIADASKTTGQRVTELTAGTVGLGGQLRALTEGAHSTGEAFALVATHLQRLHDATAILAPMLAAVAQVTADLKTQADTLAAIASPTKQYTLLTRNLQAQVDSNSISMIDYTYQHKKALEALLSADPAMAAMTAQHAAGAAAAKKHAAELKAYAESVRAANAWQWDGADPDAISGGTRPADPLTAQWKTSELDVGSQKPFEMQAIKGASGDLTDIEKAFDAKRVEDWKKELEASKKTVDEIAQHMKPLENFFVTAATTGKREWRSMVDSMIADLARLAAQKAIKGIVGAAFGSGAGPVGGIASGAGDGLMGTGYASGGTIWPSGGGTADTQSVSFRKRPDETVHINTPQQEQAYQRGGQGGSTTVQVVDGRDPRALMRGGADVQRVVLDTIRSNPGAVRALLGR